MCSSDLAGALVVGLTRGGGEVDDAGADQAEAVAVRSLGPVLSYDYKTLDQDAAAARSYLTSSYAKDYDKLFAVIKQNAPGLKAVVQAKVVDAINHIGAFDGGGLMTPVDWRISHMTTTSPSCEAYVRTSQHGANSSFELAFNHGKQLWV